MCPLSTGHFQIAFGKTAPGKILHPEQKNSPLTDFQKAQRNNPNDGRVWDKEVYVNG